MKAKLYMITDKEDNLLGVIKHTSHEKALNAFVKKHKASDRIYSEIVTPDELYNLILDDLQIGGTVRA